MHCGDQVLLPGSWFDHLQVNRLPTNCMIASRNIKQAMFGQKYLRAHHTALGWYRCELV